MHIFKSYKFIILIVILVVVGALYLATKDGSENTDKMQERLSLNNNEENMAMDKNESQSQPQIEGLGIEILKEGTGQAAVSGNTVTVHYTGWLTDGTKFDSSIDRGQPFTFQLGQGFVIQGWEKGVLGMKVGEKRRLTISPELGYGATGTPGGPIPPDATLIFEVELLGIQ